ncbi:MAG: ribbon-helix-helix protein, CopG family [Kiritimatiellae bacterium]|nr:ribbon-helix-helix protein, CopG family [Kiritimatiellia bacterium]
MRTVIDVSNDMIQTLDRISDKEHRSRASLIREAVSEYLQRKTLPQAEEAFGLWQKNPVDGLEYQEKVRNEWDNG